MIKAHFRKLYARTMKEAYGLAYTEISNVLKNNNTRCLDCGASNGQKYDYFNKTIGISPEQYVGIEWSKRLVEEANQKGICVIAGDLNKKLPFDDESFGCVFGLSVLEHILNPCHFLLESKRVLKKDGVLVLLTPNISTFFTIALLLFGKMPSTGPHPDSNLLLQSEEVIKVSSDLLQPDPEEETPEHRHLVVFSYRILEKYLKMIGLRSVEGHAFGLYPFPVFMQPLLEKIDPYHCHQMVFIAKK